MTGYEHALRDMASAASRTADTHDKVADGYACPKLKAHSKDYAVGMAKIAAQLQAGADREAARTQAAA